MKHLVEWDVLEVRVDGERLAATARQMIAGNPLIERIAFRFTNGLLRVDGSARKFISIPFSVDITRIEPRGREVRVPLGKVSAGPIPIPSLVLGLGRSFVPAGLARFEEPATLVISLDRFLPPFVDAEIQKIWIIEGGLAVTIGRGGADLPPGGSNGRVEERNV